MSIEQKAKGEESDGEGEERYTVTKLTFPADFSALQTDARLLHQIQLLDNFYGESLKKIHRERESFLSESKVVPKESIGSFSSDAISRLCDLYLNANAELASLISETSLLLATLFGREDFIEQYAAFVKERYSKLQTEKKKEGHEEGHDEEEEDEEDAEDKALDDFRKYVLSESFSLCTELVHFVDFQVARFLSLTRVETHVLEQVVLASKDLVKDDEEARESISSLSRSLFCRFSIDCEDAHLQLEEGGQGVRPTLVYFLLLQISKT